MAKAQTRKCVSVSDEAFARLEARADELGITLTGVLELLVTEALDAGYIPPRRPPRPRRPAARRFKAPGLPAAIMSL